jgi:DNA (cytosine-5)-methyltransferase 1
VLTLTDFFCGAGGSSSGAEAVPGVRVRTALNHWRLALETHNANMPHVAHDPVDIFEADPARYARTDLGWFSPECTTWSQARGEERDYATKQLALDEDDEPAADEAKYRSRLQMDEVVRFVRYHRYRGFVVENVTDILSWWDLDRWLRELRAEGYDHRIVILNSAFAQGLGAPAPQLRDRVYFVFWQTRYPAPDLDKWTRPRAWCPTCEVVDAMYAPKPGRRRPMRYGQQYNFRCPRITCRNAIVQPYVLPAAAAIDWTLPAQRIGDRAKPLQPKTIARIEAGLRRYARVSVATSSYDWPATYCTECATQDPRGGTPGPWHKEPCSMWVPPALLVPSGGTWNDEATTVVDPMRTRTTRETEGVCVPPFLLPLRSGRPRVVGVDEPLATVVADGSNHALVDPLLVPVEGRDNVAARPVSDPARAQTARLQDALVVPLRTHGTATPADHPIKTIVAGNVGHALVVPLRNNGVARPAGDSPLPTFAAAGQHHALIMRNNTPRGDAGQMSTPLDEPIRALTTAGHQSLIRWDHLLVPYYSTRATAREVADPMGTVSTVDRYALLGPDIAVEDCTFRMLDVHEIKAGMAFAPGFLMPVGAKRDKVRMLGNAVTPPAARDLIAALVEAITGEQLDLAGAA